MGRYSKCSQCGGDPIPLKLKGHKVLCRCASCDYHWESTSKKIRDAFDGNARAGNPIMEKEVQWYLRYGLYPSKRITRERGGEGARYVIGDQSWNSQHPSMREYIEHRMHGGYRHAEIKP